jgi:hypothetical protein
LMFSLVHILLNCWRELKYPSLDGGMVNINTSYLEQFFDISIAKGEPQLEVYCL